VEVLGPEEARPFIEEQIRKKGGRLVKSVDDIIEVAKMSDGNIIFVEKTNGEFWIGPRGRMNHHDFGPKSDKVFNAGECRINWREGVGETFSDQAGTFFHTGDPSREALNDALDRFREHGIYFPPEGYYPPR